MPHFTLPISADGLTLPVTVGVGPLGRAALQASAKSPAVPIYTRGLLDSGSDITVVAPRILNQLGLTFLVASTTRSVTGSSAANLFEVSLTLMGLSMPGTPTLELPQWIVMEAPRAFPDVAVLIGLDLLRRCLLVSDGPGGQFTVAF